MDKHKLQRIQNVCARLILKVNSDEDTEEILKELHWLPIEQRIVFKINLLTYKCLNGDALEYMQEMLKLEKLGRSTRSEGTNKLEDKLITTKIGDRAFINAAPVLWNKLPPTIRLSSTLKQFKASLKTFLFKKALNIPNQ